MHENARFWHDYPVLCKYSEIRVYDTQPKYQCPVKYEFRPNLKTKIEGAKNENIRGGDITVTKQNVLHG